MSSAADQTSPGALLFKRYRYLRDLGQGGMGRVLLARDEVLEIDVALKLVPDEVVRDHDGLRDLKREVLRGMALSHPNIVRVHCFEQEGTKGAIVMEFVEGETLADAKASQPAGCFEPEAVRPWLEQMCAVLDHAHREARIVHRDLKPRNVLLTPAGKIKVADFGISCTLTDTVHRIAGQAELTGTPPYMSPQQALGESPSPADDIYSLGATLYDLLTGRPPFYRGDLILQAIETIPPSLAQRRQELGKPPVHFPEAWERLIAACLAKAPEKRPPDGPSVLAYLQPSPPTPVPAASASSIRLLQASRSPLDSGIGKVRLPGKRTQALMHRELPPASLPAAVLERTPSKKSGGLSVFVIGLIATVLAIAALLMSLLPMHREKRAAATATPSPTPATVPRTQFPNNLDTSRSLNGTPDEYGRPPRPRPR